MRSCVQSAVVEKGVMLRDSVFIRLQVINGVVLALELQFVLHLVNNRRLMGRYTNGVAFNAIAWATTGVLILLSALLIGGALGIGPATA